MLTLKSPGLTPVTLKLDRVMFDEPVLVRMNVCVETPETGCVAGKMIGVSDTVSVGLVVVSATVQLGGGELISGRKTGVAEIKFSKFRMLLFGLLKMFNNATVTFVGAETPDGVL